MKRTAFVFLLLTFFSRYTFAAGVFDSPATVISAIETQGARNFVTSSSGNSIDGLLDKIGSGDSAWIAVAPKLAPGTDAAVSTGLIVMLATSLPLNPQAVLAILDRSPKNTILLTTPQVCGTPFIEAIPRGYGPAAIAAVEDVADPTLADVRERCLAYLRERGPVPLYDGANPKPGRNPVASPRTIELSMARKGAKAFWESLYDGARDVLRDQISMGYTDWIALAPSLAKATGPNDPNSVAIELAYALLVNPEAVLDVVDTTQGKVRSAINVTRVCGVPFGKAAPIPHNYVRKAITAVERVDAPEFQKAKVQCLDALRIHERQSPG